MTGWEGAGGLGEPRVLELKLRWSVKGRLMGWVDSLFPEDMSWGALFLHHSQVFAGAGPLEKLRWCARETHKPPQSSMHTKMSEVSLCVNIGYFWVVVGI